RLAAAGAGLEVHETLYWVKNALVLGRFDYQYRLDARRSAPLIQRQEPSSSTSRAATTCIPR
ncbi:MAG: hypothetical protein II943_07845, partial [Victivallales bacterium]|nr:hypothetical protein [Victivallales bacterium]